MSANSFRDFAQFAMQIYEEERERDLSDNRSLRSLGEMQKHVTAREIKLQQLRAAALAAGQKTGLSQLVVERRVVTLYNQCLKLLLWEKDAPRLTAEQLRERQQSACWTADPASEYLVNLLNAFCDPWVSVNDLAAAYDGSAGEPLQAEGERGEPARADTGSNPADGEQAEGIDERTRQERMTSLAPADRKAYLSFEVAREIAERRDLKDWEAYDLLKKQGIPEDNKGELTDYQLPAKDTWCRQLRKARQALGEQKNTPRQGRPHGKSIVRQNQIEQPDNDDE